MDKPYTARIIASFGRRFVVRTDAGKTYEATTRKKRVDFACGDRVHIGRINHEQAVIEDHLPRQSLLFRQDAVRSKLIAANVTQMLVVLAPEPTPSEMLLQRALLAAEAAGIHPLIVFNKADLSGSPQWQAWQEKLAFYQSLGYDVLRVSARGDLASLRAAMQGHCNIFIGQSGMGKSTLTNALCAHADARVGEISKALDSGKHTTTHAQWYDLDDTTQLIDSPGLQSFGLHHLLLSDLPDYFPEMRAYIGQCRFHNCTHRQEPGCALKAAAASGGIRAERLAFLQQVSDELRTTRAG